MKIIKFIVNRDRFTTTTGVAKSEAGRPTLYFEQTNELKYGFTDTNNYSMQGLMNPARSGNGFKTGQRLVTGQFTGFQPDSKAYHHTHRGSEPSYLNISANQVNPFQSRTIGQTEYFLTGYAKEGVIYQRIDYFTPSSTIDRTSVFRHIRDNMNGDFITTGITTSATAVVKPMIFDTSQNPAGTEEGKENHTGEALSGLNMVIQIFDPHAYGSDFYSDNKGATLNVYKGYSTMLNESGPGQPATGSQYLNLKTALGQISGSRSVKMGGIPNFSTNLSMATYDSRFDDPNKLDPTNGVYLTTAIDRMASEQSNDTDTDVDAPNSTSDQKYIAI